MVVELHRRADWANLFRLCFLLLRGWVIDDGISEFRLSRLRDLTQRHILKTRGHAYLRNEFAHEKDLANGEF